MLSESYAHSTFGKPNKEKPIAKVISSGENAKTFFTHFLACPAETYH